MRSVMLLVMAAAVGLLAACGGGEGDTASTEATPTPEIPLETRAGYTPGTLNNPFRMVIQPIDAVPQRVNAILAAQAPEDASVTPDADLRDDLGLTDDLSALDAPLSETFDLTLRAYERESIRTVEDLVTVIWRHLGEQIRAAIRARTGLSVEVDVVRESGVGLDALCDPPQGIVALPWLNGVAYAAAVEANCGQPGLVLQVTGERGVEITAEATPESTPEATAEAEPTQANPPTPEPATGDAPLRLGTSGVIVLNRELGTTSLDALDGRTFCRLGLRDYYSWIVPSLLMARDGADPQDINDYPDTTALLEAVADGTCAGAGFSAEQVDTLRDLPAFEDVRVAAETPVLPYAVMAYPLEVELGVRQNLGSTLPALFDDLEVGDAMKLLLGGESLQTVNASDFADLMDFIDSTGYDLARLGN